MPDPIIPPPPQPGQIPPPQPGGLPPMQQLRFRQQQPIRITTPPEAACNPIYSNQKTIVPLAI